MKKLLLVLAIVAALPVATAGASPIAVTYKGTGDGVSGGFAAHFGSQQISNIFAGEIRIAFADRSEWNVYCLDIFDTLTTTEWVTLHPIAAYPNGDAGDPPPHAQSGVGTKIGWLLNLALDDLNGIQAAGLQMAIWEVAFENAGSYDLDKGLFSIGAQRNDAVQALSAAKGYLAELVKYSGSATNGIWLDVVDNQCTKKGQDFGVAYETPVPEPASMLLLGSGLLGIGAAVRRRKGAKK